MATMFKRLSFVLLSLIFLSAKYAAAQLMIEQGPSASTRDGGIYIYGLTGKENRLRYEKINGSPFLNEAWSNAMLYDRIGNSFGRFKVRLNIATHEVHYIDKFGIEKADNGQIARIELDTLALPKGKGRVFSNDEEVVRSKFKGEVKFAEHLNEGYYTLLRVTVRQVSKSDSMFSTMNKYYFKDNLYYFLKSGRQTVVLKRLTINELRKYIPAEKWPLQRNDFAHHPWSKEEDMLRLLDLINKAGINND